MLGSVSQRPWRKQVGPVGVEGALNTGLPGPRRSSLAARPLQGLLRPQLFHLQPGARRLCRLTFVSHCMWPVEAATPWGPWGLLVGLR